MLALHAVARKDMRLDAAAEDELAALTARLGHVTSLDLSCMCTILFLRAVALLCTTHASAVCACAGAVLARAGNEFRGAGLCHVLGPLSHLQNLYLACTSNGRMRLALPYNVRMRGGWELESD